VERELTRLVKEVLDKKDAVLRDLAIQRPKLVSTVVEARRIIAENRYLETFRLAHIWKTVMGTNTLFWRICGYLRANKQSGSDEKANRLDLSMTQVTLSLNTRIDISSAYCFIGKNTVLACGATHTQMLMR
jgi:hypothetical protein